MNDLIGFIQQDNWLLKLEVLLRFVEAQKRPERYMPGYMGILMEEQGCDCWEEVR